MLQKSCIFIMQYFDTALMQGVIFTALQLFTVILQPLYTWWLLSWYYHKVASLFFLYFFKYKYKSCAKCPLIVVCTTRFFPFSTLTIVSLRLWSHLGTLYGQFWSWSFYASWFLGRLGFFSIPVAPTFFTNSWFFVFFWVTVFSF